MKINLTTTNRWVAGWLCSLAGVAILSLLPSFNPPKQLDKMLHFICYFILSAVPVARFTRRDIAFLCAGIIPSIGVLLEYMQNSINGRTFSAEDMLANNLGVVAGIAIGILLRLSRKESRLTGDHNE